jgi:predicted alpha-1,2-mannosidase
MGAGDTGSMIGQHGASVVVDTWLKGLRDFDVESMWPVMKATADGPLPAGAYGRRDCIEKYVELGYIPHDECGESVSKTLEYAFNDYCLAELARDLGHDEDADRYGQRAGNFANLWDDDTGFFRPRFRDGTWEPKPPFDPLSFWSNGYTEGSPWQWRWFAPHDESGLRALFGDNATFLAQLIEFFEVSAQYFDFEIPNSWYFHGNEPDIHAPFLFIGAGRPDLTQKWVRWLMDTNYRNTYDGLIGNDDAGTISAWYVFSAVGLFPWPCFPGYYITTPLFDRVVMHLPGGDLVVEAPGASAGTRYISEARFNGELLEGYWLTHEQVAAGGTLSLTLSETP